MTVFGYRFTLEISVHHGRRKIDEMTILAARAIKRIFQRAKTVVESAERIFVGAIGMRDGGQLHNDIRFDVAKASRQHLIVPRINYMQGNVDLA